MARRKTPVQTLRAARKARRLSQKELAYVARLSQQALSRYENGAAIPPPKKQVRLATVLGIAAKALWPSELQRAS